MDQSMKMLNGGEASTILLVFLALVFAISPVLGWAAIVGSLLQVLDACLVDGFNGIQLTALTQAAGVASATGETLDAALLTSSGTLADAASAAATTNATAAAVATMGDAASATATTACTTSA